MLDELRDRWLRDVRPILDPHVEGLRAEDNPASEIQGVAQDADGEACVLVAPDADAGRARAYAEKVTGESPRLREREPVRVRPHEPDDTDGYENAFPGRLVGGKALSMGGWSGTLGIVARDPSGDPVMVSNHHVLTPEDGTDAAKEERAIDEYEKGGTVPHPDGPIGRTMGWKQFTTAHDEWPNRIDAAIGRPLPSWGGEIEIAEIGGFGPVDRIGDVKPGDRVIRTGARTGTREGVVELVRQTIRVTYEWGGDERTITLDDTVQVEPRGADGFSDSGDSGSPVFKEEDGERVLVGLHFAGNPDGLGDFCRIQRVFDAFDLRL